MGGRIRDDRWEHGSDFHLSLESGVASYPWDSLPHGLWGSGRSAIRALLAWGAKARGWRRLWVPSYYCHDVLSAIRREIDVLAVYDSAPSEPPRCSIETHDGDVVLVPATFGMRPVQGVLGPAVVLEDHSHDLGSSWAWGSRSDYAFASLRKTMPLPDGGVLWSPNGREIPPEPAEITHVHSAAVLQRLSAMTLKSLYLSGGNVDKSTYRELAIQGERTIGRGQISAISEFTRSRLRSLPIATWRAIRARNLRILRDQLRDRDQFTLLNTPFAATLLFADPGLRQQVGKRLVEADIYPAVLWPLDERITNDIPERHVMLSRRMLTIHCDQRYGREDMIRVANGLAKALAS